MAEPGNQRALVNALNQRFATLAGWSYDYRWVVLAIAIGLVNHFLQLFVFHPQLLLEVKHGLRRGAPGISLGFVSPL